MHFLCLQCILSVPFFCPSSSFLFVGLDVQAICANFSVQLWFHGKKALLYPGSPEMKPSVCDKGCALLAMRSSFKGTTGQITLIHFNLCVVVCFIFVFLSPVEEKKEGWTLSLKHPFKKIILDNYCLL